MSAVDPTLTTNHYQLLLLGAGALLDARGKAVQLRNRKTLALLAYLAVERSRVHRRDSLIGLLWPELPQDDARNNLRVTLARLRRVLDDPHNPPILADRLTVQFNPDFDGFHDTYEFQTLLRTVETHGHEAGGHPSLAACPSCLALLTKASTLYQAEFLQGFQLEECEVFEEWLFTTREHLAVHAIEIQMQLTEAYRARGESSDAEEAVRRWLALDSLQEIAHRHLMELLVQNGRRHAALVQYEACRQLLEDELGAPPADETVALYQQIRDGKEEGRTRGQEDKRIGSPDHLVLPLSPPPFFPSSGHLVTFSSPSLFGIDAALLELSAVLAATDRAWLVSIDGIGGIGKTTLAQELTEQVHATEQFARVVWISAKQEEFRTDAGITPTELPVLDADLLVDELLGKLTDVGQAIPTVDKEAALRDLLKAHATLVVIDNLETVADYQALVPALRQWANPSKFLITSRESLSQYQDVFCLTLGELAQPDAFDLLRYEGNARGIRALDAAPDAALAQITAVVGGHPLALSLVLGQLVFLPLSQVLTSLKAATGQRVAELYTYIYWQAWQTLDDASRQLFLTMPMVKNGTYAQLSAMSLLDARELQSALAQLIGLSLVQVAGDLLEPRYRLHRLTETFLMNEVLKWQSP